jgi:hypothetical protein
MTNEEAQFLLQGYRPDGRDAQAPQLAEALEQMKRDPTLQRWFEEQQAFDKAITEKLRSEPIPPGLKGDILAGGKTLHVPGWWRRHPVVTALAACLAALIAVATLLLERGSEPGFLAYRGDMVQFVTDVEGGREPLQLTSGELAGIRAWIAENSAHETIDLPASLTEDSGIVIPAIMLVYAGVGTVYLMLLRRGRWGTDRG